MFPVIQYLRLEEDDLTYLINYTFSPQRANGAPSFTMQFKTIDPPIIKTFFHTMAAGSVSTTLTETIEWDETYLGTTSTNIRASANNMMLVGCKGLISGGGSICHVHASAGIDTADGTKVIDAWNPLAGSQFPPVPIILDVNQYFTLSKVNGASARTFTIEGFTVELPSDFALS